MDCSELSTEELQTLCNQLAAENNGVDNFFLLWASTMVLLMHAGFAMLTIGAVRSKNVINILLTIVLDAMIAGFGWFLVGWAFAYGTDAGGFIGTSQFLTIDIGGSYKEWLFQYSFAATASSVTCGAIAGRAKFEAYLSYSFFLSVLVYPVVVHAIWSPNGFLALGSPNAFNSNVGVVDFAGCGPVHMIGGLSGLIGAKLIGPRIGRFDGRGKPIALPGHSAPLATLGVFLLWVGWFGFNCGSAGAITGRGDLVGLVSVNTLLASAGGALAGVLLKAWLEPGREWNLTSTLNGLLAGLVSITAICAVVETYYSFLIGVLGAIIYLFGSDFLLKKLLIDDPLDAVAVHFLTGSFGLLLPGFWASPALMRDLNPDFADIDENLYAGVFYGGNGNLLLGQFVAFLYVVAWVSALMFPYFSFLKYKNWFRVTSDEELLGLDLSHHNDAAYPEHVQPLKKASPEADANSSFSESNPGQEKQEKPQKPSNGVKDSDLVVDLE